MERSEPALVPEWLRSTGSVTGGGSSVQHFASSSSHTDIASSAHHLRNRSARSTSDFDSPRSTFLDRTSSSNSRRHSSNGSSKHAYGSFSRNNRDKDREREKDRSSYGDHWDNDSSDALASILTSRVEKNALHRSHSMVSRKQGDLFPRRVAADLKDSGNGIHSNGNGLVSGSVIVGSRVQKAAFEKDFPSLGTEEKLGVPDIPRVSSPSFVSPAQSLPFSGSTLIGGERWTSALAEVPTVVGTGSAASLSVQPTVPGSGVPSTMSGLNMAEALAQPPLRSRTDSQLSINTQRLEELAIKQSRQLIPVTPSMPKGSVVNSSDKSKPKTVVKTGEMGITAKSGQQQPSVLHQANQSHVGNMKSDMIKTTHGKLLVLKQARENGVLSPTQKDIPKQANMANGQTVSSQLAAPPTVASAPLKSSNSIKLHVGDRKAAASNLLPGFTVEKRSMAQTQSRHDFFNTLKKKKKETNASSDLSDAGQSNSSPIMEKSEVTKDVADLSATHDIENGAAATSSVDNNQESKGFSDDGEKSVSSPVLPDEEAAFLRSLGWDGKCCEDEGLTEEEINDFYQELVKLRPTLKLCCGLLPKLPEGLATNLDGASSALISSDSESA